MSRYFYATRQPTTDAAEAAREAYVERLMSFHQDAARVMNILNGSDEKTNEDIAAWRRMGSRTKWSS